MNTFTKLYFRGWRVAVLVLSMGLIAYVLYFHHLATLLPGYSAPELNTYRLAATGHNLINSPLYAPYTLFVWLTTLIAKQSGIETTRLVAASFGTIFALIFFMVVRQWYSFRVAFLASVLFATSAGFLHAARLGTGDVLQMSVLVFIGVTLWYRHTIRRVLAGYIVAAVFALLWYVPGMLWFELLGLLLLRRSLRRQIIHSPRLHVTGWATLFIALITPLAIEVARTPQLLLQAAGLPIGLHNVHSFGSNVISAVMTVAVRSNGNPLFWVGHAPLLDVIEVVLGIIGAYVYLYKARTVRSIFLSSATLLSIVLIGLNGGVVFACVLPFLYLWIAAGLNELLGQWLRVFPRNPIARISGVTIVCLMLFFSVLYQVRSYFVAWPHTTATRQTFEHTQP